jgi:enterochelin esterase-like enzyme
MKTLILSSVLLASTASAGYAQAPRAPRIVSPDILADRRVTFRLQAPQAREVILTGEFLEGHKNFASGEDGVWTVTVGPISPDIYYYNFSIDGVRTIDPMNPNVKTGSTPSTISSVLEVKGDSPAFYDGQNVAHGEVHTHWYHSTSLDSLRRLTVYTPPGYESSQTRLPVLYLFHGANADETAWVRLGHVNLILDNLLASAKTKPFIVVMPFGYGVDPMGPQQTDNTARFAKDLTADVIPYVQSHYRASPDRTQRAIFGLSMGGGESLSIGLNHLDLFSYVGGFSSALGQPAVFPKTYANLVADSEAANKNLRLLWIGCGTEDSLFNTSKSFSEFLNAHHVKHTFRQTGGAHTWMVWRRYLNEISPLLFQ